MKRNIWFVLLFAVGIALLAYVLGMAALNESRSDDADETTSTEEQATTTGDTDMDNANYKKAMFGAGCFWGVEAAFRQVEGVKATAVGFSGGHVDNPSYKEVCYTNTGHAEVVQVTYDPSQVTYEDLLNVFWDNHDPTQVNRQGPDVGSQYRSAIFYYDGHQKEAAEASKRELAQSRKYKRPIATEITEASEFWMAEEYHQQYLEKRGLSTCKIK